MDVPFLLLSLAEGASVLVIMIAVTVSTVVPPRLASAGVGLTHQFIHDEFGRDGVIV